MKTLQMSAESRHAIKDERLMKLDQALKLAELFLCEVAESLRAGRRENVTRFLEVMARFPSCSLLNVMLIAAQRPNATYVAGLHAWRQLGRRVIKGEKGIGILAAVAYRAKQEPGVMANSDNEPSEQSLRQFRLVRVFDISQTEGEDLAELDRPQVGPGPRLEMLEDIVRDRCIELEYSDLPGGTLGVSAQGMILIQSGLDQADAFAVLTRELAHKVLPQFPGSIRPSRNLREVEADAVAQIVCHAFGLDSTKSTADYIQLYNGDLAALSGSLRSIQLTAAKILVEMSRAEAVYYARKASFVAA